MDKQLKEIERFKSVAKALQEEGWSMDKILDALIKHIKLKNDGNASA